MAEIQREQAEVQRTQAERSATHDREIAHIRRTLSKAGDKLDALIDIVDGFIRRSPRNGNQTD